MKATRSILHVDLQSFFVSVERSLDPALRGKPLIVGGSDGSGLVAAASTEVVARGVRPGQPVSAARRACPEATVVPGDLEAYARVSDEVTAILLAASRRVERPSADEAYVDLTREGQAGSSPVPAAEAIKDELQRRLGLDATRAASRSRSSRTSLRTWPMRSTRRASPRWASWPTPIRRRSPPSSGPRRPIGCARRRRARASSRSPSRRRRRGSRRKR